MIIESSSEVEVPLNTGDHIAGFAHACNCLAPEDGAFGDYALVKGDVAIKLPDSLSFEEGATLGVAVATIELGLCQKFGLALPDHSAEESEWVMYMVVRLL